jgi:hypothetical protein
MPNKLDVGVRNLFMNSSFPLEFLIKDKYP